MSIQDKIKVLCDRNEISKHKLEVDLNFSNGSISKAKTLPFDRVVAIADYFQVPIEYFTSDDDSDSKSDRMIKYGLRLKQLREVYGYTQEALAEKLGTTRSRIANYEQGIREPDFEMQEAIADLFHVTIDYLFGRETTESDFETPYDKRTVHRAMEYYKRINQLSPDKQAVLLSLIETLQDNS